MGFVRGLGQGLGDQGFMLRVRVDFFTLRGFTLRARVQGLGLRLSRVSAEVFASGFKA